MLTDLLSTVRRNADTLASDALGAAALFGLLFAGLTLPVL